MLGRGLSVLRKTLGKALEYAGDFLRADNGTIKADSTLYTADQITI